MRWRRRPPGLGVDPRVDPSTIRFSTATICDRLPSTGARPVGDDVLVLHEDDWRQTEVVSQFHRGAVADNFDMIDQIKAESTGLGYIRLHVRAEPAEPLERCSITADDVRGAMIQAGCRTVELAIDGTDGPRSLSDGVAYIGPDLRLYATFRDGIATVIGLQHSDPPSSTNPVAAVVRDLAMASRCYVVDWQSTHAIPPLG